MKYGINVHSPEIMNLNHFGESMTFQQMPREDQSFCLSIEMDQHLVARFAWFPDILTQHQLNVPLLCSLSVQLLVGLVQQGRND